MTIAEFDTLIQSKNKDEFVVVEFKLTEGSESCIPPAVLIKHGHRLNLVPQTFDSDADLVKKYGVQSAPDILLIKIKTNSWVTGLESLLLILQSIE